MTDAEDTGAGVSLYVHVPFCASRCAYCDFHSTAIGVHDADGRLSAFVDSMIAEAALWSPVLAGARSLYFGGGTPTVLGGHLPRLVEGVSVAVEPKDGAEVTVEANPDSTGRGLVEGLVAAGVNRVSLGVQSFDDGVLRTLGRRHDARAAEEAARVLRSAGVRFSVDLMCGVPGQTARSWADTLQRAVATGAGHVSVYPLSLEAGTGLARRVAAGELPAPDPDAQADMMLAADDVLASAGLERYETASFAGPGEGSRHNLGYWTGRPYVGIGPSARSMLPAGMFRDIVPDAAEDLEVGASRIRFAWATGLAVADVESLGLGEAEREDLMLGMRLAEGVRSTRVEAAGLVRVFEGLASDGLVDERDGRWRATQRGWLLGNEVFGRIWNSGV